MKIPKKIKIGGHWFNIIYNNGDTGFRDSGFKGSWSNIIVLNNGLKQSKRESVLLHEIIHEISWQHDLDLKEEEVSTIAEGLYQVLVDNKLLKE